MVTIMIPTKNHSDFEIVIRQLSYYADIGFKHWIFIADSSEEFHLRKTKDAIDKLRNRLNILYKEYPGKNNAECFFELNKLLTTPYVAFCGDDDFLIPQGIEKCMEFLKDNRDYVAAHGTSVLSVINPNDENYGISVGRYLIKEFEEEESSQRLLTYARESTVVMFALHRSEAWKVMFRQAPLIHNIGLSTEVLPCCISVIIGKIKNIKTLYLVRQVHPGRFIHSDIINQISDSYWPDSFIRFKESIIEELCINEALKRQEACDITKEVFRRYLKSLMNENNGHCIPNEAFLERTKSFLKKINYIKKYFLPFWRKIRDVKYKFFANDEISLFALLSKYSIYHTDFMPVYKVLLNSYNMKL